MATMNSGGVCFDGVTDEEVSKLLTYKTSHQKEFNFDPQTMKRVIGHAGRYDNVRIDWTGNASYAVSHEAIMLLLSPSTL